MLDYTYERFGTHDYHFVKTEAPNHPMHVACIQVLEAGPLRNADGGIDIDRIKETIHRRLHLIPRYRQRIDWTPIERFPIWVDDHHFRLDYHVRHTSLPRPGSAAQLKRLAGRIMAQPLDLSKPPWESWIVEGLEGDRFAIINKTHQCMFDAVSGADLTQLLMSPDPDYVAPDAPPFHPRPLPSSSELFVATVRRVVELPLRALRGFDTFRRETEDVFADLQMRIRGVGDVLGLGATPASRTPINGPVGPHRAFEFGSLPLADLKAVRRARECTLNTVILAMLTGALREFFEARQVPADRQQLRVTVPVTMSTGARGDASDGIVEGWTLDLPIDETDPLTRVARIREATQALRTSRRALGVETMRALGELTPGLVALAARTATTASNTYVTNVPGPQVPLYLCGARMESLYLQPPLMPKQGLAIATMSYDGRLCWGLTADPEILPDLDRLADMIPRAFDRLATAADARTGSPTAIQPVDQRA